MLNWNQEEHRLKAVDDMGQYLIVPSNSNAGYDVFYLPAPGPPAAWAQNVLDLEQAKERAEECSQYLRRQQAAYAHGGGKNAAPRISAYVLALSVLLVGLLVLIGLLVRGGC